ncbi:uncharacterized protein BCR38DRAFT_123028 [Pseudomassariella vexata]|uniref:Apopolysialoglycoprotein n=1 Tax=Pseudomassariella vexata TaxID=1141098 RepID=A0A1Y2DAG6_9PEZI|nr:uncharacterized protein BCR38DRAFT_123028 [Pseudomassariella vexata]ORY55655.1 hypothetical protein BCR38DRAFT_123028 [Pseudomassariella vexata]
MAPYIRPNTQTRRGARGAYVEHDDFEGLPVRQWRQEWVSVVPPPPPDTTQKNDVWAIELPHGMPKDSQLLPTHTQELLRAARSGRLYKRPAPVEEEEAEADAAPEKPEKKEEDPATKGFMVKVWKQIPRNAEGPTISHLAKRRKTTVTLSSDLPAGQTSGPTVTKATVRRVDAAGNPYTQEVTLTEGQPVDGEIISTTIVPAPNAAGHGDGSSSATPVKRRPPPPKRKPKGPGRGRKKKLPLPENATHPEPSASGVRVSLSLVKPESTNVDGIKQDGDNGDNKNQDTEMADGDDNDEGDDDEGEDGEDGSDDDEEGDGPDNETGTAAGSVKEDSVDQEMKGSPFVETPETSVPPVAPAGDAIAKEPSSRARSPSPQPSSASLSVPFPIQPPAHLTSPRYEGSPLKNVVIPSPTDPSTPNMSPIPTSFPTTTSAMTEDTPALALESLPEPAELLVGAQPSVLETMTQENAIQETQPADVEMTNSISMQTDTIMQAEVVLTSDAEPTAVIVEEVVETTTVPLNDQQPPVDPPAPVEEVTDIPESPPTANKAEESLPVADESTNPDQSATELSFASAPEAETPMVETQATELTQAVVPEEPVVTEEPAVLPALHPLKINEAEAPATPTVDENEPESPDLLGGLEAALDQHSEPNDLSNGNGSPGAPPVNDIPTLEPIINPAPALAPDSAPTSAPATEASVSADAGQQEAKVIEDKVEGWEEADARQE